MAFDHRWLGTSLLVTSSIISVTANLTLIFLFFRRRGLRTVSNRFVINLLITNLLSGLLLVPLLLLDHNITEKTITGETSPLSEVHPILTSIKNLTFIDNNQSDSEELVYQKQEFYQRGQILRKEDYMVRSEVKDEDGDYTQSEEIIEDVTIFNLTQTRNEKDLSSILCYLAQSSTSLVCTASIFSILLIAIDQYFAVLHSLRYHSYINKFKSFLLISVSWGVSLVFAVLNTLTQSDSNLWQFCRIKGKRYTNSTALSTIFAFVYFIFAILLPFVTICIIYVCIYTAAHENSERMRKSTSSQSNSVNSFEKFGDVPVHTGSKQAKKLHKVHSAPNFVTFEQDKQYDVKSEESVVNLPEEVSSRRVSRTCSEKISNSLFNSIRFKLSNASIFRYREESRAAKISILVIFMVLICYLPYGLALILNSGAFEIAIPSYYNYISLLLLVISNIASPFLFVYRNRRVQRELWKFLRCSSTKQPTEFNSLRREIRRSSFKNINSKSNLRDIDENTVDVKEPFLTNGPAVPSVVIDVDVEKKSILKRVCSKNWPNYKKCNFITVPDSCLNAEARGSFSSTSTQVSSED